MSDYDAVMADLAPGFLIASPPLGDPNFERTVVLLALHNERGALGFVINRVAPLKLGEVMSMAGYGPRFGLLAGAVRVGGPVEPGSGWVLSGAADVEVAAEGMIEISPRVRISSSRDAFDALARDLSPVEPDGAVDVDECVGRRIVLLGYSGWGPGQLEGEIAQGAWLPAPFDERVLFDTALDAMWEATHALIGISPAMGMGMRTVGEA